MPFPLNSLHLTVYQSTILTMHGIHTFFPSSYLFCVAVTINVFLVSYKQNVYLMVLTLYVLALFVPLGWHWLAGSLERPDVQLPSLVLAYQHCINLLLQERLSEVSHFRVARCLNAICNENPFMNVHTPLFHQSVFTRHLFKYRMARGHNPPTEWS